MKLIVSPPTGFFHRVHQRAHTAQDSLLGDTLHRVPHQSRGAEQGLTSCAHKAERTYSSCSVDLCYCRGMDEEESGRYD